jgi:hypothetical protein
LDRALSFIGTRWGTAVPIVRERDVYSGRLTLQNLPTTENFRVALRVYDFDAPADRRVRLRVFPGIRNNALVDVELTLTSPPFDGNPARREYPRRPGTVMIGDLLTAYPQLQGITPLQGMRIEIEPLTPGLRFWAFGSATHNTTQDVTLSLPD